MSGVSAKTKKQKQKTKDGSPRLEDRVALTIQDFLVGNHDMCRDPYIASALPKCLGKFKEVVGIHYLIRHQFLGIIRYLLYGMRYEIR